MLKANKGQITEAEVLVSILNNALEEGHGSPVAPWRMRPVIDQL